MGRESAKLAKAAAARDQAAANARTDLGVVMADLPRVETLAQSVSESFRAIGTEAAGQAGNLEAGLIRLNHETGTAQEVASAATQRLTAQIAQIELATERARNQLETLAGRINENVDSALIDRESTRMNSSHYCASRMPSS